MTSVRCFHAASVGRSVCNSDLFFTVLCCAVLCCFILCCVVLCCAVLYCSALSYTVNPCTVLLCCFVPDRHVGITCVHITYLSTKTVLNWEQP